MSKGVGKESEYELNKLTMKDWEEPERLELLEGLKRRFSHDYQIAEFIGKSRQTLCAWKKKSPLIFDALKRGKIYADIEEETSLNKSIKGYFVTETKTETVAMNEKSEETVVKITRNRKYIPPNVTAIIYYLKHQVGGNWQDNNEDMDKLIKAVGDMLNGVSSKI